MSRSYYRVRLGEGGKNADECLAAGFIGTDFRVRQDLSGKLPEDLRTFNREFIPVILAAKPEKSRVGAGLNAGALWTVSKGIMVGDVVLSPDATGRFHVGEVAGDYFYEEGGVLPHRRRVTWLPKIIDRTDMSDLLWRAMKPPLTVVNITAHAEEMEALLEGSSPSVIVSIDEEVEDPVSFAMEKHLEDFLVRTGVRRRLGRNTTSLRLTGSASGSSTRPTQARSTSSR